MGQRHQIIIQTENPKSDLGELSSPFKKALGRKKVANFSFHNQWLFARSALICASNVLDMAALMTLDGSDYNNPLSKDRARSRYHGDQGLLALTKEMAFVHGFIPPSKDTEFSGAGMKNTFPLLEECIEGNKYEESFDNAKYFDIGDNNDGITIIDAINRKYCFMNISNYSYADEGDLSQDSDDLPYLKPVSGAEYLNVYCPENVESMSKYTKQRASDKGMTPQEMAVQNKKDNAPIIAMLADYEVLTVAEICKMFPAMADKVKEANKVG